VERRPHQERTPFFFGEPFYAFRRRQKRRRPSYVAPECFSKHFVASLLQRFSVLWLLVHRTSRIFWISDVLSVASFLWTSFFLPRANRSVSSPNQLMVVFPAGPPLFWRLFCCFVELSSVFSRFPTSSLFGHWLCRHFSGELFRRNILIFPQVSVVTSRIFPVRRLAIFVR